jgi:2'-5' RNA ligase
MHLYAALVPPLEVATSVSEFVARVEPPWITMGSGPPGRHLASAGRIFGRRRDRDAQSQRPTGPFLDLVPPVQMHLPLAKFGNLALTDVDRLTERMESEAKVWQAPRLTFAGGVALEPEGDVSAWVGLSGDIDALNAVTRGVTRTAQGLQLFVDRRVFRPHVRLGSINDQTTTEYLEELLANLEDYESASWWQSKLLLVIPAELGPDKPPYKVHAEIALGPPVSH